MSTSADTFEELAQLESKARARNIDAKNLKSSAGDAIAGADIITPFSREVESSYTRAIKLGKAIVNKGADGISTDNPNVVKHAKASNKLFSPRGNIARMFYDKRPIVGLGGPAGTGKSRGILEKIHLIAEKYDGCRILIARKVREGLTEAALFTYEEHVLPEGHVAHSGPKRSHRQSYLYANGSVINVAGLDKPQKIMSTEYDIIYVQEATECDESDFEFLNTRLRNGVVPYQQLLFDCNPEAPTHWIYQNSINGKLMMYDTEHEDNPRWFELAPDGHTDISYDYPVMSQISKLIGRFSEIGKTYLEKLDALTGARYLRLRKGKWAAAEGQIYDGYDSKIHLDDHFNPPVGVGHWLWTVDFGWTKPFVLQMWWIDPDGCPWLWRELYHTQKLVEEHAADALEAAGWSYDENRGFVPLIADDGEYIYNAGLPDAIICDHDAEGRATLEVHLHLRVVGATKAILEGIDAVKARMKLRANSKPGIKFMRASVWQEDKELKDKKQPLGTVQEIDSYIWKPYKSGGSSKETPIDEYNHGMDAMRYLICYLDGITGGQDIRANSVPSEIIASPPIATISSNGSNNEMHESRIVRRENRILTRESKVEAKRAKRGYY